MSKKVQHPLESRYKNRGRPDSLHSTNHTPVLLASRGDVSGGWATNCVRNLFHPVKCASSETSVYTHNSYSLDGMITVH